MQNSTVATAEQQRTFSFELGPGSLLQPWTQLCFQVAPAIFNWSGHASVIDILKIQQY